MTMCPTVSGPSFFGIVGSYLPRGDRSLSLVSVVCCQVYNFCKGQITGPGGVLPYVVCLCVI
jgi:hypothetical protein